MNFATTQLNETKLRGLLDGTLDETEQAEVLALVESNPQWQQALERLAAGAETWQAAARHLHEPPLAADAALRSAIAAVQPPTIAGIEQPPVASAKLDFLSPVDDPHYLGRFGDYLVERIIGRGGFGIVLQAFDPQLRRIVALKVLAPHFASNTAACLRFQREAKAAAAVVHDHVITIHAVHQSPLPHLVMQYVAGQSLQEKLDKSGPLSVQEVLRIGMQTAAGLAAAHKHGEVHRDIKPANILLENGVERVKITDFGLARAADDASMTQSGVVAGTPQYMSPEQARGDTVDARSDLFSLGSVLYAMCAGHPPFRATTTMGVLKRVCDDPPRPIREVNPEVPPWLAAIIDRLMAKQPADRFASAAEVAELLGQCLSHVQQPGETPLPQHVAGTLRVPSSAVAPSQGSDRSDGTRSVPATDEALLEQARRAVREPAIGLIITAVLNWLALAFVLLFAVVVFGANPFERATSAVGILLMPLIVVFGLGSTLLLLGGLKMLRLENYPLALAAGVGALFIGPVYFVGFPMGLWTLVVLQRKEVKQAFTRIRRRHWPGLGDAPAELPAEGEWSCRCVKCGYVAPLHKWGGVRIGGHSRGKRTWLWCPSCRWMRWMAVERFSAKSLPPKPAPPPIIGAYSPRQPSSGIGLVLFVLFLLFAIPLMLAFAAVLGYFLMSSGGPPAQATRLETPSDSGSLIFQSSDPRLTVLIHQVKTPDGEHIVSTPFGPGLRHNQFLTVPAGEYHAQVLCGEIPVREDVFHVVAGGPPKTYWVAAGGTLRIVSDESDGNLVLTLNDVTHHKHTWRGAADRTFVIPEGLVHVDLRRADAGGRYEILTTNFFDVVAGQETLLRVKDDGIELAPGGVAFDAIVAAQRSSLEQVEAAYAAGRVTKNELVSAQLALAQARLDWASKVNRPVLGLSIRQEIIGLAEENERLVRVQHEAGTVPLSAVNEAHVAVLKHKQQLQQAVAELKVAGKLPADYELPPHLREVMLRQFDPSLEKPEVPPWADVTKTVSVEDGTWRIENNTGFGNFRVWLAKVTEVVPEDGILICRAQVKLQPGDGRAAGDLELNSVSPSFVEYDWPAERSHYTESDVEWKQLEVRYPAHLFWRKGKPEVPISVGLHSTGVMWVKDLELWHLPQPAESPFRRPEEKVVRSFSFKDRPLTEHTLFDSALGWRYSPNKPMTAQLFELRDLEVQDCRLTFRCRMKTKNAAGAGLRLFVRYPDGTVQKHVDNPADVAQGDTDWATYSVTLDLQPGIRPELVKLELAMNGGIYEFPASIWFKDVELLQSPLAQGASAPE